jgi:hypothetical protein
MGAGVNAGLACDKSQRAYLIPLSLFFALALVGSPPLVISQQRDLSQATKWQPF